MAATKLTKRLKNDRQTVRSLYEEALKSGEPEELKDPGLDHELDIARLELAALLADEDTSPEVRLKALQTIAKIAKTAKQIKDIDAQALGRS